MAKNQRTFNSFNNVCCCCNLLFVIDIYTSKLQRAELFSELSIPQDTKIKSIILWKYEQCFPNIGVKRSCTLQGHIAEGQYSVPKYQYQHSFLLPVTASQTTHWITFVYINFHSLICKQQCTFRAGRGQITLYVHTRGKWTLTEGQFSIQGTLATLFTGILG